MKLSIKDFFSKCDQILNGKLQFLCSVAYGKGLQCLRKNFIISRGFNILIKKLGNSPQNTFKIGMSLVFDALVGCRFLKLVGIFSLGTFLKVKVVCEITLLFKGYYASLYLKLMV